MGLTCISCRFEVERDDAVVPFERERCVCLYCERRMVGDERHPTPALVRDLATPHEDLLNQKIGPDVRMTAESERDS